jgi:hypothetical protein
MQRTKLVVMAIALLGIVSCFMPWLSYALEGQRVFVSHGLNVYDTKFYGLLTLLVFVLAALLSLLGKRKTAPTGMQHLGFTLLGVGVVVTLFVFVSRFNARITREQAEFLDGVVTQKIDYHFGWGIWLALAAALLLIAAPTALRYAGKSADANTPPVV